MESNCMAAFHANSHTETTRVKALLGARFILGDSTPHRWDQPCVQKYWSWHRKRPYMYKGNWPHLHIKRDLCWFIKSKLAFSDKPNKATVSQESRIAAGVFGLTATYWTVIVNIYYTTILYYTILYYTYTIRYDTIRYYTTLHYTTRHDTTLHYTTLHHTAIYYTIVYYYYTRLD